MSFRLTRTVLLFHSDLTQSDELTNWAVLGIAGGVELIDSLRSQSYLSEDAENTVILLGPVMLELVFQGTES